MNGIPGAIEGLLPEGGADWGAIFEAGQQVWEAATGGEPTEPVVIDVPYEEGETIEPIVVGVVVGPGTEPEPEPSILPLVGLALGAVVVGTVVIGGIAYAATR